LIDTMMKVMDGPEAVAAVRQHEWNRQLAHMPVLAVTASILRPDQEMCMRAGYQGVIAKPIAVKSIATEVLNFLERWKEGPESKMIRSPHDWRSDPFCSLMRNNMVRVPRPPSPRSLFLPLSLTLTPPPPPLPFTLSHSLPHTSSLSLPTPPHTY
jgi:DNA-binding response OmpR family regulator